MTASRPRGLDVDAPHEFPACTRKHLEECRYGAVAKAIDDRAGHVRVRTWRDVHSRGQLATLERRRGRPGATSRGPVVPRRLRRREGIVLAGLFVWKARTPGIWHGHPVDRRRHA